VSFFKPKTVLHFLDSTKGKEMHSLDAVFLLYIKP